MKLIRKLSESACVFAFAWLASAQEPSPFQCVDKFRFPSYNSVARDALITGEGRATLKVGDNARAINQEIVGFHPVLELELKRVIDETVFLESCIGRTLVFQVKFEMAGEPSDHKGLSITYEYPNFVRLQVRPPIPRIHAND